MIQRSSSQNLSRNDPTNLSDPTALTNQSRKLLIIMSRFSRRQFHQIQIFIQQIQSIRIHHGRFLIILTRLFHHPQFELVHDPKEFLGSLDRGQVFGCLRLIDAEGIAEEVHGRFHIVPSGVVDGGGFAVSVFFGAYSVDILLFSGDYDCFGYVEEVLRVGVLLGVRLCKFH